MYIWVFVGLVPKPDTCCRDAAVIAAALAVTWARALPAKRARERMAEGILETRAYGREIQGERLGATPKSQVAEEKQIFEHLLQ